MSRRQHNFPENLSVGDRLDASFGLRQRQDAVDRRLEALGVHQREHLDELVDSWHDLSDTVAERAVALGFAPDGRAATVSSDSEIDAVDAGSLDTDAALHELIPRLADVTERIRVRMDRLGEIDLASQDVLIEVVRELEKQLWMLRVSLPGA